MMSSPTLGLIIRKRRMELGLTQEMLAERIGSGVRQAEISRLEHDRVALPRRARLNKIAHALDIPVGTLLARSGWAGAQDELGHIPIATPSTPSLVPEHSATAVPTTHQVSRSMMLDPELGSDLFSAIARSHEIIEQTRAIMHEARLSFDRPSSVTTGPHKLRTSSKKTLDPTCE